MYVSAKQCHYRVVWSKITRLALVIFCKCQARWTSSYNLSSTIAWYTSLTNRNNSWYNLDVKYPVAALIPVQFIALYSLVIETTRVQRARSVRPLIMLTSCNSCRCSISHEASFSLVFREQLGWAGGLILLLDCSSWYYPLCIHAWNARRKIL